MNEDKGKRQSWNPNPDMPYRTTDNTDLKIEDWQNAMGILQKTFLLTRAMGHFWKKVALIGA